MQDFRKKFNGLPQNIQDVLFSNLDIDLNLEIGKKNKVPNNLQIEISSIVDGLFLGSIKIDQLIEIIQKKLELDKIKAKAVALDIAGIRLFIFDDFFEGGISNFIKSLGGKAEDYQEVIVRQQKIIDEAEEQREEEKEAPVSAIKTPEYVESDDKLEKEHAPKFFKESVLDFLILTSGEIKDLAYNYNGVLMILMEKDPEFKRLLEQALLENKQKFGRNQLLLKGKQVSPSVANWLKDFIDKNGTGFFDQVVLSQYVTNSDNAKKLNEQERKLLSKLLTMYRNIKFFPQALANTPIEKWQIIPIDIDEDEKESEKLPNKESLKPSQEKDWDFLATFDVAQMTPIELKAFMEENDLTLQDIEKLKTL